MYAVIKPAITLVFGGALALAAGAPAFAQYESNSPTATNVGPSVPPANAAGLPYANVNAPGPNGQCWVMNNKEMGFGYWGECAGGPAPRSAGRRARASDHSAHAAVPAGSYSTSGLPTAEPTTQTATTVGPSVPPANAAGLPYANVNTPGENGQCWVMNNKEMGFGYWGECAAGAAQPTVGSRSRRHARR
jgi:hypothetical protein